MTQKKSFVPETVEAEEFVVRKEESECGSTQFLSKYQEGGGQTIRRPLIPAPPGVCTPSRG